MCPTIYVRRYKSSFSFYLIINYSTFPSVVRVITNARSLYIYFFRKSGDQLCEFAVISHEERSIEKRRGDFRHLEPKERPGGRLSQEREIESSSERVV